MSAEIDADAAAATNRIVLSYPADLTAWDREQLETPWYQGYLRKILSDPKPGDVYEEFVDIGCCGSSRGVPLKVESVDLEDGVDEDTTIEYTEREACELPDAWDVQSAEDTEQE